MSTWPKIGAAFVLKGLQPAVYSNLIWQHSAALVGSVTSQQQGCRFFFAYLFFSSSLLVLICRWMLLLLFFYLTVPFVADGSSQLLLTLRGLPEAVGVKVDTRATGVIQRPAAEYGVAVISPAVVDPFLNAKVNTWHPERSCTTKPKENTNTHVLTEESDPHGGTCAVDVHGEDRLYEGVCHTCQGHVSTHALLQGLKPGEVLRQQEECVVVDGEGLRGDERLLHFIWKERDSH